MPKEKVEYTEVGGWLLWLCIGLTIGSPMRFLISLQGVSPLTFEAVISQLVGFGVLMLSGIFLWSEKAYAVKFAKISFIWVILASILGIIMLHLTPASMEYPRSAIEDDVSTSAYSLIPLIIWTIYLFVSKRVRGVYGGLKEKTEGLQIWPIVAMIFSILDPSLGITFGIVALINIKRNKNLKGMGWSIVALILSVIVACVYLFVGALSAANFDDVPSDIETSCVDYCSQQANAENYLMEYSTRDQGYVCYCMDKNSNTISDKLFPDDS